MRETRLELRPAASGGSFNSRPRVVPRSLPDGSEMLVDKEGVLRVTLRSLPAFEEEVLMPPEDAIRMRYQLIYRRFTFGKTVEEYISEGINQFIGKPAKLQPVAQQLVAPGDAGEAKVRKIYAAVHGRIRNLSFEEGYTKKERKRENMRERKSAEDVWQLGYGTALEIAQLFVGLCRAEGLASDLVYVVPRETNLYDPEIPLIDQLEWPIAVVDLPEGPRYFDPGTRFAPFGWIGWQYQGTHGARVGNSMASIRIPQFDPQNSGRERKITLEIQPNGGARVLMVSNYIGQSALDRRNEFFDLSAKQIERKLRDELEDLIPQARLQKVTSKGLDGTGEIVEIAYEIEVPDLAQRQGDRLIIRPILTDWTSPFAYWKRTHPVYLPQSYVGRREVRVVPPPGYRLAHEPPTRKVEFPFAMMETIVAQDGSTAVLSQRMTVRASLTRLKEEYADVKRFFDYVAAGDQIYLVFQKSPGAEK